MAAAGAAFLASPPRTKHHGGVRSVLLVPFLVLAACGEDDLRLVNRTDQALTLDLHGPKLELTGGCDQDFRQRFCAEEYEPLGVLTISPGEDRLVTLFEGESDEVCTNLLWIRVLQLGGVGPVREPGTVIKVPAVVEIETGAGNIHSAAFPDSTIRVDEVGELDENQGPEPPTCAALGRAPR